jgi:hypothetical protein
MTAEIEPLLRRNETLVTVLERARALDLPDWYVSAGAVYQTVWNGLTGRPPAAGIRDYDLSYHDASDLSWEAEDAVIRGAASVFDADVEVRNQARVHLWYEDKWGVTCPPHASTEAAIATFPATAACIGVRLQADGGLHLHTAYGTEDLLALVVRPNRVLAPREVYEAKVARWSQQWPELFVMPW